MDDLQKSLMREMIREELAATLPGALSDAVRAVKTRPSRAKVLAPDLGPVQARLEQELERQLATLAEQIETRVSLALEGRLDAELTRQVAEALGRIVVPAPDLAPFRDELAALRDTLIWQVGEVLTGASARLDAEQAARLAQIGPEISSLVDVAMSGVRAAVDGRVLTGLARLESRQAQIEAQAMNLINSTESRVSQHLAAAHIVKGSA